MMYHKFKLLFYVVLVFLLFIEFSESWRIFHNGRSFGGNLGLPNKRRDLGDSLDSLDDEHGITEEWFVQKLDHFTPGDSRVWKQRYFTNTNFYSNSTSKGPVFLMIGGEGEASKLWMSKGAWITYAEKFGALCFQLEHRYYGKSRPTSDLSTKNLQYLSSEQALFDLATFITAMNEKYNLPSDAKWIAFGGSYPGSLAAWLRLKYPHLVHGAMSASGPLLAKADFKEYYQVVDDALSSYNEQCTKAIEQGTNQVSILLKHMIGQRHLNQAFNLCHPIESSIENKMDMSNFYESLASNWAGIVQYNKDNRIGNKTKMSNITLEQLCDIMVNESLGTPVSRLAQVNSLLLNASNQTCLDYKYDVMIKELRNVSWDSEQAEGGRQWMYQTCTEFGFYQTSAYKPQIFGDEFPVGFFEQQCIDIFGPKFNANFIESATQRTNTFYGALNIDATNIVFVHGSVDPWHALGITKTLNQNAPAIYIKGTAHCANMYPSSEDDLPQLKQARVQIQQLIGTWLRL